MVGLGSSVRPLIKFNLFFASNAALPAAARAAVDANSSWSRCPVAHDELGVDRY